MARVPLEALRRPCPIPPRRSAEETALLERMVKPGRYMPVGASEEEVLYELRLLRDCLNVQRLRREGNPRWLEVAERLCDELKGLRQDLRERVYDRFVHLLNEPVGRPVEETS